MKALRFNHFCFPILGPAILLPPKELLPIGFKGVLNAYRELLEGRAAGK
jgi:hypothetical protein